MDINSKINLIEDNNKKTETKISFANSSKDNHKIKVFIKEGQEIIKTNTLLVNIY